MNTLIKSRSLLRPLILTEQEWDNPWAVRYLRTIGQRQMYLGRALRKAFSRGAVVLECGFDGWKQRAPGVGVDKLSNSIDLSRLLASRACGFGLDLRIVG